MLSFEFIDRVRLLGNLRTTREARKWTVHVLCGLFHTIPQPAMQLSFCAKLPRRLHELVAEESGAPGLLDRGALIAWLGTVLNLTPRGAEIAVRTVYRALLDILSPGEGRFLLDQLPPDIGHLLAAEGTETVFEASTWEFEERSHGNAGVSPILSGGDVDARWDLAEFSGEETAGGSVATPDQSVVDELGEAVGVTYAADEELRFGEKQAARDRDRWELDPASAEDFDARNEPAVPRKSPFLH